MAIDKLPPNTHLRDTYKTMTELLAVNMLCPANQSQIYTPCCGKAENLEIKGTLNGQENSLERRGEWSGK